MIQVGEIHTQNIFLGRDILLYYSPIDGCRQFSTIMILGFLLKIVKILYT